MNNLNYEQQFHDKIREAFGKPMQVRKEVNLRTLAYELGTFGPYQFNLEQLSAFKDLRILEREAVKINFEDGLKDWESDFLNECNTDMQSMNEDIMDKRRMNHTPDISQADIDERRMNDDVC